MNNINLNTQNIYSNFKIKSNTNSDRFYFGNSISNDKFEQNSITSKIDEKSLLANIDNNPELKALLEEYNIPIKLNMTETNNILANHSEQTKQIAFNIYENLPPNMKRLVNKKALADGAKFHDLGKVLIPANILNKKGQLSADEQKIMDLHSEIGYLLLKNMKADNSTLNLVRYHHLKPEALKKNSNYIPDINVQILNLADKYSAMIENRVYRSGMAEKEILNILQKESNPIIFNALKQSTVSKNNAKVS